eukprot:g7850.t1
MHGQDLVANQIAARTNPIVNATYAAGQQLIGQSLREVLTEVAINQNINDTAGDNIGNGEGTIGRREFAAFFDRSMMRTAEEQRVLSTEVLLRSLQYPTPPRHSRLNNTAWTTKREELISRLAIEYGGRNATANDPSGTVNDGKLVVAMDTILIENDNNVISTMSSNAWLAFIVQMARLSTQKHFSLKGLEIDPGKRGDADADGEPDMLEFLQSELDENDDVVDNAGNGANEKLGSKARHNFTHKLTPLWREQVHPYVNVSFGDRLLAGRLIARMVAKASEVWPQLKLDLLEEIAAKENDTDEDYYEDEDDFNYLSDHEIAKRVILSDQDSAHAMLPGLVPDVSKTQALAQKIAGSGSAQDLMKAKQNQGELMIAGHPGGQGHYNDPEEEAAGTQLDSTDTAMGGFIQRHDGDLTAVHDGQSPQPWGDMHMEVPAKVRPVAFVDIPANKFAFLQKQVVLPHDVDGGFGFQNQLGHAFASASGEDEPDTKEDKKHYASKMLNAILERKYEDFDDLPPIVRRDLKKEMADEPETYQLLQKMPIEMMADALDEYDKPTLHAIAEHGSEAEGFSALLHLVLAQQLLERNEDEVDVDEQTDTRVEDLSSWLSSIQTLVRGSGGGPPDEMAAQAVKLLHARERRHELALKAKDPAAREKLHREAKEIKKAEKARQWPQANGALIFAVWMGFILDALLMWLGFYLPLSFLYRLFGQAIFTERERGIMEIQFIYGLPKLDYWRLWTPSELLLVTYVVPFCAPVAGLMLSCALAVLIDKRQTFEGVISFFSGMGNLCFLFLHVRIMNRGHQLLHVLWVMRHQGSEHEKMTMSGGEDGKKGLVADDTGMGGGVAPRLQKHPGRFNVGMRPHSLYYCARDNSVNPPQDALLRDPVFDIFQISSLPWRYEDPARIQDYADAAGATDLAEQLGADYWIPAAAEYLSLVLNVVFCGFLLYYCEKRRHAAEAGDAAGTVRAAAGRNQMLGAKNEASAAIVAARQKKEKAEGELEAPAIEEGEDEDDGPSSLAAAAAASAYTHTPPSPVVQVGNRQSEHEVPMMELRGLTKSFAGKLANNNISFAVNRGEIFGLLGHNGAGKTTMLSQITCMIPCTSGDVLVDGVSVHDDVSGVRKKLAFCPQTNPLWDAYTLRQHVFYFARLRGVPETEIEATLSRYATLLGLQKKVDTNCDKLSGGQKRRLWVMCSLLGDAPLILLDEATSGMDPQARRDFWVLLKKIAREEKRSIVFSTHYLEEADLLADRKVIIAAGKVMALGTSMELKRQWGVGFWIYAMVEKAKCPDKKKAKQILQDQIPVVANALKMNPDLLETKNERVSDYFLAYSVPWEYVTKMADVLDAMIQSDEGKMVELSVEQTTLQEVFALAGQAAESEGQRPSALVRSEELAERDRQISRQSLRPRMLSCGLQWRAIFEFRLSGEGWRLLSSVVLALLFILAWWGVMARVQRKEEEEQEKFEKQQHQDAVEFANANNISLEQAKREQKNLVDISVVAKNMGAGLLAIGVAYVVSPLAFHVFGAGVVKNAYMLEAELGLARHLRMHGIHQSAYHFGSALCWFAFLTLPGWIFYGFVYMATMQPVFGGSEAAALAFWIFVVFFSMLANLLVPMLLTRTLSGAWWTVFTIGCFGMGFLSMVLDSILNKKVFDLDIHAWVSKDGNHINCDLLTELMHTKGVTVASQVMHFGFPYWWSLVFLPLGILFPPVATGQAICGLYKLWALTLMVESEEDPERQVRGLRTLGFFFFGQVPDDITMYIPELSEEGAVDALQEELSPNVLVDNPKILTGMREGYAHLNWAFDADCNGTYFNRACWVEVWAPVWSFLFYLLLFLVYEFYYLPNRQIGTRFQTRDALRASCGEAPPEHGPEDTRDPDVVAEENRENRDGQALDMVGLYKHFADQSSKKLNWATKGVSLSIPRGECFGLLGPNGAGKTTLFSMVSGNDEAGGPDLGKISILDKDTASDGFSSAREVTGLAPQFDKLWPHVSGRRHLRLYSKICGMYNPPENKIAPPASAEDSNAAAPPVHDYGEERISRLLREVSLSEADADRKTGEYSGGMKRKLSVALTMITDPSIVFLDEMSAGVDIVAQRSLWNKLIYRPVGQTIISTTHSMMEAEATSDRIGILVGGRLKAVGTTHRIKSRYGSGYHLELIVNLQGVSESTKWVSLATRSHGSGSSATAKEKMAPDGPLRASLVDLPFQAASKSTAHPRSKPEGDAAEEVFAAGGVDDGVSSGASTPRGNFKDTEMTPLQCTTSEEESAPDVAAAAYDQQLRRSRAVAPMPVASTGKEHQGTTITFENIESAIVDSLLEFDIGLERREIRVLEKIQFSDARVRLCLTLGWLPDVIEDGSVTAEVREPKKAAKEGEAVDEQDEGEDEEEGGVDAAVEIENGEGAAQKSRNGEEDDHDSKGPEEAEDLRVGVGESETGGQDKENKVEGQGAETGEQTGETGEQSRSSKGSARDTDRREKEAATPPRSKAPPTVEFLEAAKQPDPRLNETNETPTT